MPATAIRMSEQELSDNVIELAHLFGWRIAHFRPAMTKHGWRTPVAADGKGFPDLVMVKDRVLFLELKSHRGSLTDEQIEWQEALTDGGAEQHVVRPQDWVDGSVEALLRHRSC
jgi:hypothetical protein